MSGDGTTVMAKYRLMFPRESTTHYAYVRLEGTHKCWYQFHSNAGHYRASWALGADDDIPLFDGHELFVTTVPLSWCKIKRRLTELGYKVTTPPEANP